MVNGEVMTGEKKKSREKNLRRHQFWSTQTFLLSSRETECDPFAEAGLTARARFWSYKSSVTEDFCQSNNVCGTPPLLGASPSLLAGGGGEHDTRMCLIVGNVAGNELQTLQALKLDVFHS